MLETKAVGKNFIVVIAGQLLSNGLNFITIMIAARYLSVEEFGLFSGLLAISTIAAKFIDFGFTPIVFREVTKSDENFFLLNTAVSIRLMAFPIILLVFCGGFFAIKGNMSETLMLAVLMSNSLISAKYVNIRELMELPFRSDFNMHYPMLGNNMDNIILLIAVLTMPFFQAGVTFFVLWYSVSNLPGLFFILHHLRKRYDLRMKFNFRNARWLFHESYSIYTFVLLSILFQQFDLVLLESIVSRRAVALYSVASRLTVPLNVLVGAVIVSVLPIVIKNLNENRSERNLELLDMLSRFFIVVPYSYIVVFSFKTDSFISLFFGGLYLESAACTIVLLWTQLFLIYSFFILNLLTVFNNPKSVLVYSILLWAVNLILDVILIPKYSLMGAAWSKLISSFIGFLSMSTALKNHSIPFLPSGKTVFVWCAAFFVTIKILAYMPVVYYLFLSVPAIFITIYACKVFSRGEYQILKNLFIHKIPYISAG